MTKLEQRILEAQERVTQLERRNALEVKRTLDKQRKTDTARRIKIGELVEKHFPEVLQFQPKFKKVDNELEFAPLENFIAAFSESKEMIEQIKTLAK
jgi:hypothetical protein